MEEMPEVTGNPQLSSSGLWSPLQCRLSSPFNISAGMTRLVPKAISFVPSLSTATHHENF